MWRHHLIRLGIFGHVGRFTAVDAVGYPRGTRVVCRTSRGLEVGSVLGPAQFKEEDWQGDGSILRAITVEDDLLLARQAKSRDEAMAACEQLLRERGLPGVLMDVEHLFDGGTLYFYFLGDVSPEVEALTGELAEQYDSHVRFGKFAQAVTEGCGPGCGTEAAAGFCGSGPSGACASCGISGKCGAG